ncbi:MAG: prolipoprotein diacylglyceryl transferase [Phycisphaerales bacterium]|nr:prolipoprotein diacylglyceryl transferase [Phycisphaerales bacterium]
MHPELFRIPFLDHPVKSYGAMLTLGFLTGVWLSMRRAERMKCDPDLVLNLGFIALVGGVAGARIFYVLHYWESSFARQPNPLFAALNCTSGGLEYYGGLIGAIVGIVVYILIKRVSMRLYLDLLAPAAIWGLAFGRMGCLLNGCCWGGLCVDPQNHAVVPWGITFPHRSPAQMRQWENRQLTLPAELIVTDPRMSLPRLVSPDAVELSPEKRSALDQAVADAKTKLDELKKSGASTQAIEAADADYRKAMSKSDEHGLLTLEHALRLPSRASTDSSEKMTVTELADLVHKYRSRPVHPVQVYGIINALLLSWFLLEVLYHRKRHGMVFALLCTIYPITRMILEVIRVDNPHDSGGMTISQAVSVGMFLFGIALIVYLRRLPERSPLAVPYVSPYEEEEKS